MYGKIHKGIVHNISLPTDKQQDSIIIMADVVTHNTQLGTLIKV